MKILYEFLIGVEPEDVVNGRVEIPKGISSISSYAFYEIPGLEYLELPEGITEIKESAITDCPDLKYVKIPGSLKVLNFFNIRNCPNLTKIDLGEGLTEFSFSALEELPNLQEINFPKSLVELNYFDLAFDFFDSLHTIKIPYSLKLMKQTNIKGKIYIKRVQDGYILTDKEIENADFSFQNENVDFLPFLMNTLDNLEVSKQIRSDIFKSNKREEYVSLYSALYKLMSKEQFENFVLTKNSKFFEKLDLKSIGFTDGYNNEDLSIFFYNLGLFQPTIVEERVSKSGNIINKEVNYAQIVGEWLKEKMLNRTIMQLINSSRLEKMKLQGFKPEFTKFLLDKNNFAEMMQQEMLEHGFIIKCYNCFEEIQATNTSNKGSQHQLKPTVKKFIHFFMKNKFSGITEDNLPIAETISPYFDEQEDFDNAVSIMKEKEELKTPNNIIAEPQIEDGNFDSIDEYIKEVESSLKDLLSNLIDIAVKEFTFEWLAKNDPTNLILGKLCSCCAHLAGAGYGIMHASIVHPDVQNLVIRDKTGKIIAKSTLFVNRKQGYGVCNNVEIDEDVPDEDKQKIYDKIKEAIKLFAEKYNSKYPDIPLQQINVGMNNNDLEELIISKDKESEKLLQALNYGEYGIYNQTYEGDSSESQYVLWEKGVTDEFGV